MGTENVVIRDIQRYLRSDDEDDRAGDGSYITGASTANQRIESWHQNEAKNTLLHDATIVRPERDGAIGCSKLDGVVLCLQGVWSHRSTISRLVERYQATGSSNDHPRTGGPRVTTAAQDRANRPAHFCDRFRPATSSTAETIGTHHRPVSAKAIRIRLCADDIPPYRPFVGSVLTPQHRRARVEWCTAHRRWTLQSWSQVVFSDEKMFQCFRADGPDQGIVIREESALSSMERAKESLPLWLEHCGPPARASPAEATQSVLAEPNREQRALKLCSTPNTGDQDTMPSPTSMVKSEKPGDHWSAAEVEVSDFKPVEQDPKLSGPMCIIESEVISTIRSPLQTQSRLRIQHERLANIFAFVASGAAGNHLFLPTSSTSITTVCPVCPHTDRQYSHVLTQDTVLTCPHTDTVLTCPPHRHCPHMSHMSHTDTVLTCPHTPTCLTDTVLTCPHTDTVLTCPHTDTVLTCPHTDTVLTCPHTDTVLTCPHTDTVLTCPHTDTVLTCPHTDTVLTCPHTDTVLTCPHTDTVLTCPHTDTVLTCPHTDTVLTCPHTDTVLTCPHTDTVLTCPHKTLSSHVLTQTLSSHVLTQTLSLHVLTQTLSYMSSHRHCPYMSYTTCPHRHCPHMSSHRHYTPEITWFVLSWRPAGTPECTVWTRSLSSACVQLIGHKHTSMPRKKDSAAMDEVGIEIDGDVSDSDGE
ncbi:hypothetical protein WMY93_021060 [Mugilogobius chulae]|uniref:Uncharacterized protein n=1 Tax=Mugilogobius chulae TaxID=88201 RepID=A0AAW0NCS1_9GOBI